MTRRLALLLAAVLATSAIACESQRSEDVRSAQLALTPSLTLTLPAGMPFEEFAVLAQSGSLLVRDGVKVRAEDGSYASIANLAAANSQTSLGVEAETGSVVSAPAVELRDRAKVRGAARSKGNVTLGSGALVEGSTIKNTTIVTRQQTSSVTTPVTNQGNVTVANDAQRTVAPGAYATVLVRAAA